MCAAASFVDWGRAGKIAVLDALIGLIFSGQGLYPAFLFKSDGY